LETAKKHGEKMPHLDRAATLPTLPNVTPSMNDSLPQMPTLGLDEKTTTLPIYTSRPASPGSFEMGSIDGRRPMHRTGTSASNSSFSSRAPLLSSASDMGYSRSQSPAPSLPDIDLHNGFGPPSRTGTMSSQRSFANGQPGYGPVRNGSTGTPLRTITASPAWTETSLPAYPGSTRPPASGPFGNHHFASPELSRSNTGGMPYQPPTRPYSPYTPHGGVDGRASPAPSYRSNGGPTPVARSMTGPTGSMPYPRGGQGQYPPQRNMTAPMPTRAPQRGPPQDMSSNFRSGYEHDVESQQNRGYY
jgi:hypothetical protein